MKSAQAPILLVGFRRKVQGHWPKLITPTSLTGRSSFNNRENIAMQTCGTAQNSNLRHFCTDQMYPPLSTADAFGNALKATVSFPPRSWFSLTLFNNSYAYHHLLLVPLLLLIHCHLPGWDSFFVVCNYSDIARLQLNDTVNNTAFTAVDSDVGRIASNSRLIPIVQRLETEFPMSEISGYSWVIRDV